MSPQARFLRHPQTGESLTVKEWAQKLSVSVPRIYQRVSCFGEDDLRTYHPYAVRCDAPGRPERLHVRYVFVDRHFYWDAVDPRTGDVVVSDIVGEPGQYKWNCYSGCEGVTRQEVAEKVLSRRWEYEAERSGGRQAV